MRQIVGSFFVISLLFFQISCTGEADGKLGSCIEPPGGPFQPVKVNISFASEMQLLVDGEPAGTRRLDSITFQGFPAVAFSEAFFSNWIALDEPVSLDISLYASNEIFTCEILDLSEWKPGGFLLIPVEEEGFVTLRVQDASESMIRGICDDVIIYE